MTISDAYPRTFEIRPDFVQQVIAAETAYDPDDMPEEAESDVLFGPDELRAIEGMYEHAESTGSAQAFLDFIEVSKGFIDVEARGDLSEDNILRVTRIVTILSRMPSTINIETRSEIWRAFFDADELASKLPYELLDSVFRDIYQQDREYRAKLYTAAKMSLEQKKEVVREALATLEVDTSEVNVRYFSRVTVVDVVDLSEEHDLDLVTIADAASALTQAIEATIPDEEFEL